MGSDKRSPGQVPRCPETFPDCVFAQTPTRHSIQGDGMLSGLTDSVRSLADEIGHHRAWPGRGIFSQRWPHSGTGDTEMSVGTFHWEIPHNIMVSSLLTVELHKWIPRRWSKSRNSGSFIHGRVAQWVRRGPWINLGRGLSSFSCSDIFIPIEGITGCPWIGQDGMSCHAMIYSWGLRQILEYIYLHLPPISPLQHLPGSYPQVNTH